MKLRDNCLIYLKKKGIDARQMVNSINSSIHINKIIKKRFKNADKISKSSIHLPSGTSLSVKEIDYISKCVKNFFLKKK